MTEPPTYVDQCPAERTPDGYRSVDHRLVQAVGVCFVAVVLAAVAVGLILGWMAW